MPQKLGQVFLKDQNIIDKIVEAADLNKDDIVIEIGCGEGWMTERIAAKCKKLYVIELDERWLKNTQERLKEFDNIEWILADVLKDRFTNIKEQKFKVVANIPYYISAKMVKLLIEVRDRLDTATIMVQKEFALKLIAESNTSLYTSLTLFTRHHLDTQLIFNVSKTCFRPIPKVDSAVINLSPLPQNEEMPPLFFDIIRSSFWARRKPLLSALSKSPYLNLNPSFKEDEKLLQYKKIRGETLTLDDFYAIYKTIKNYHIPIEKKQKGKIKGD